MPSKTNKAEIFGALEDYFSKTLTPELMKALSKDQKTEMSYAMMAFCLCHKHKKKENKNMDFSIVRDVMYRYSKKS